MKKHRSGPVSYSCVRQAAWWQVESAGNATLACSPSSACMATTPVKYSSVFWWDLQHTQCAEGRQGGHSRGSAPACFGGTWLDGMSVPFAEQTLREEGEGRAGRVQQRAPQSTRALK